MSGKNNNGGVENPDYYDEDFAREAFSNDFDETKPREPLEIVSSTQTIKSQKIPFKLTKLENGNILTIHHTVKDGDKLIRIRMAAFCFSQNRALFVVVDRRGNIFIFDLTIKKYWRMVDQVPKVTTIVPSFFSRNEFLIGTKMGVVVLIDIDEQMILNAVNVSEQSIVEISFPGENLQPSAFVLVHAGSQAILLNLEKFTTTHRLDFDAVRFSLKFASYIPFSEHIFTCFTNDAINIWSGITLNTLRVLYPIKARDRKLKLLPEESVQIVSLTTEQEDDDLVDDLKLFCQDQDYSNGLIVAYAFRPDGSIICLSTLDQYLLLISTHTYDIQLILRLKNFILVVCAFMPKNKETLIIGLTTVGQVILIDCQQPEFVLIIHAANACKVSVSGDGQLVGVLSNNGEVYIWSSCKLYNMLKTKEYCFQMLGISLKQKKPLALPSCENSNFNEELKQLLKHERLMAILKEFGCYPSKFRGVIWCSLLQLPCNSAVFQELVKMGIPSTIKQRASHLNIKSEANRRSVLKIWSCLAHWCKIFAYSEFLPHLIYPFLQVYPKNGLVVFELCATLLMNHFQLWFEFHPLTPSNYLGMCANVLQYFDKELYRYYNCMCILPKHFAWSLLSNAFSEVLDSEQWLCLWDNILSCPSSYLVFCVVAYNILNREILLRLPNADAIEHFFHEQNPIDICKLIKKAYKLMMRCPCIVHPKRYLKRFSAIPKGVYPKFLNFPQEWVKQQEEQIELQKQEQRYMDARLRELELEEQKLLERLESGLKEEEHAKRAKEMEEHYQNALKREEERLATQRKMLLMYQKEIRSRKGEVLVTLRESERRKKALELEKELDALTCHIERERLRNDSCLMAAEDELRNQEFELLTQKYKKTSQRPSLQYKYREDIRNLSKEKDLMKNSLNDFRKLQEESSVPMQPSKSSLEIIEDIVDEIQKEFLSLTSLNKKM